MKTRLLLLLTGLLTSFLPAAQAQDFVLRWTFDGDGGVNMNATTSLGPVIAHEALSSSTYNTVGVGTGATEFWAPAIHNYNSGSFFEFTLGLDGLADPYVIDRIRFSSASFLHGATDWELRTALDTYTSVLASGATNTPAAANVPGLNLTFGGGDLFTFRLIGTGGNADVFNGFIVDHVTVYGSVSAIPEPSTYAALLGFTAIIGAMVHRRRRATALVAR